MTLKNRKAIVAVLTAALAANAILPMAASAASTRTKAEAFGDTTYKERFLSLYDDVITKGQTNGYLSSANVAAGGFGVPYHSVETLICEAPDYGHETTSEAMSYIVWVAAMRDNLTQDSSAASTDLTKAWETLEMMIPTTQTGMMKNASPSATYTNEWETPEQYPQDMLGGNTGVNPIQKYFMSAYSGDSGLYLMHWLADVDNWYGYGTGTNFTFINSFQRGAKESCWETVPHPSIEELKFGSSRGVQGVFTTETNVAKQWRYTNAPDAEDRAIQAVYWANKWGVGNASITKLAGKMGDEVRNNMFDKYYKAIGCQNKWASSSGYSSAHYLMSWYTSWGGALDGSWTWQIGASHMHEFYQNPLAAYALINDSGLNSAMLATDATKDYTTSLERQLEFYEWLQSSEGPIAGGATNSWNGRYETYPTGSSTFYDMAYVEHPVYEDPGSNHWIGNQTWAMQRIAELYYTAKQDGKTEIASRCESILDKWVGWFIDNTLFGADAEAKGCKAGYAIPQNLDWSGQPDKWTGTKTNNSSLHATVRDYADGDLGCVASLANTLTYYAKAKGVEVATTGNVMSGDADGKTALATAQKLMDCMWTYARDDIGLTIPGTNGSYNRFFEQEVWVPTSYGSATLPNGGKLANGTTFLELRPKYKEDKNYAALKADYDDNGETDTFEFTLHRFWHQSDIMMALGGLATLYPELTPAPVPVDDTTAPVLDKTTVTVAVGKTDKVTSDDVVTWTSKDTSIATVDSNGVITGVAAGTTTVTATNASGLSTDVTVTVTAETTTTTPVTMYGDVNLDGRVTVADVILINKAMASMVKLSAQQIANGDVTADGKVNNIDGLKIMKLIGGLISTLDPTVK